MAQTFDICIRGAGIVGRSLALLLARERLRVALVDESAQAQNAAGAAPPAMLTAPAAPALATLADVRAFALNVRSRELLESLRCWPAEEHATPVLQMQVSGDEGGVVNFSAAAQRAPALAWIVDVSVLEAQLAQAIGFQHQIECVPRAVSATLTVVCEGRASATRAELGIEFDVLDYAQSAIAARIVCPQPHLQTARQWFTGGQVLGCLPMGGNQGNSFAIVWSVPDEQLPELRDLDDTLFCEQLAQISQGVLQDAQIIGARAIWPLQKATASRWSGTHNGQAWVLAGDAAHTVHPLAGQGLNLGLADVRELVTALAGRDYWRSVADDKLLRRYERTRKTDVLTMGSSTDALQRLFTFEDPGWRTLRNAGMTAFNRFSGLKHWAAQQAMGR